MVTLVNETPRCGPNLCLPHGLFHSITFPNAPFHIILIYQVLCIVYCLVQLWPCDHCC